MNSRLKRILGYSSIGLATLSVLGIGLYSGNRIHNYTYRPNTIAIAKNKCKYSKVNYSKTDKLYKKFEAYQTDINKPDGGVAGGISKGQYEILKKFFNNNFSSTGEYKSKLDNPISFDRAYLKSLQRFKYSNSEIDDMSTTKLKHLTSIISNKQDISTYGEHESKWYYGYHTLMDNYKVEKKNHPYGSHGTSCNPKSNKPTHTDKNTEFTNPTVKAKGKAFKFFKKLASTFSRLPTPSFQS